MLQQLYTLVQSLYSLTYMTVLGKLVRLLANSLHKEVVKSSTSIKFRMNLILYIVSAGRQGYEGGFVH